MPYAILSSIYGTVMARIGINIVFISIPPFHGEVALPPIKAHVSMAKPGLMMAA